MLPDPDACARYTITLMTMSAFVTMNPALVPAAVLTFVVAFFAPAGVPAHSGHLIPTALKTMQSVQIGRPQFEQLTAVSARGWR